LTKEDLNAKLHAVEQKTILDVFIIIFYHLKALEEERHNKLMLKHEHNRAVMNALDVFRKSEISNSTYDQDDHH